MTTKVKTHIHFERRLVLLRECERRERRPRVSVLRAAREWSGHARTRAVSNNARRQRSIDRWMMRRFETKRRRRKSDEKTGPRRTSVSSWTACPGAYPAYPAMSESPESPKVLARSTQPSERERPKKRSTTVSSPKAAFLCVVERVVVVVPFFLPSFLLRHFSKRTKKNKQTNKLQTNEERNKHTKVLKIRTKYSRVAYLCA